MTTEGGEICTMCVANILKYISRNRLGFAYLLRQVAFDTGMEVLREGDK